MKFKVIVTFVVAAVMIFAITFNVASAIPVDEVPMDGVDEITPENGQASMEQYQPVQADTVQADAYASISSLPSTGLMFLLPAAGLLAGGAGALILRKKL